MSDIIHLLPDSVANQIAAGEVIQRPASVIKELMENSIDAKAASIKVLLTDAGKTQIQVIDDGIGMSETDARLAFERHATSKIKEASDLFALHTMGFRGEALASIAAVAQVELRTRMDGMDVGTKVSISGSLFENQEVISCPKGTAFVVNNLFFNVPARRKFLKSNQTELSNILTEFERIALVHPEVNFELYHNGTELYKLPSASLKKRLVDVFGKKLNEQLLSLNVETTLIKISGYVGKPESSRKKGANQYFFVNGRYMRHPYFHKAVMESFENLIPTGEQIPYYIYMEVDPANIDVNIHPTKTEIKFENEQAIWQILAAAVKEALGRFNEVPSIDFDTDGMPEIPIYTDRQPNVAPPQMNYNANYNPFESIGQSSNPASRSKDWDKLYEGLDRAASKHSAAESMTLESSNMMQFESSGEESPSLAEHYQYKGQYILTSVKSGLLIMDQHYAHVQVLYEQYLRKLNGTKGASQGVLFPEVFQIPSSEQAILEEIMPEMELLGFELANLGGGSYAVNGIPSGIDGLNPVNLVQTMIRDAADMGKDVKSRVRERIALTIAHAAAIVKGQVLSEIEMDNLVASLFACRTPMYTIDGNRVFVIISDAELIKLLK